MCLLLFAVDPRPDVRLVVAANRDEFWARPAAQMTWWADAPNVLAGRDLEAGGTWMGTTHDGRWAALTNVRDPQAPRRAERSRGHLVADFLRGSTSATETAASVHAARDRYDGFNLVLADAGAVCVVSTRSDQPTELGPGVYGLSNDRLDVPWPKVERGRAAFRAATEAGADLDMLLDLLDDRHQPPDAALPDTDIGMEWERRLAPMRIVTSDYGTRLSTALVIGRDGRLEAAERTWAPDGTEAGVVRLRVEL
ncbi:MAG: NRDE family protein [Bacteroidota bacterium]